jgi:hypothetical protein
MLSRAEGAKQEGGSVVVRASRQGSIRSSWPGHSRSKDGVAFARLVPAIHVFLNRSQDVDARHKAGHDETQTQIRIPAARYARVVRQSSAPKYEGVGNAGCPLHPQPRVECSKHAR